MNLRSVALLAVISFASMLSLPAHAAETSPPDELQLCELAGGEVHPALEAPTFNDAVNTWERSQPAHSKESSYMSFRAKCRITGVFQHNSAHPNSEGKTPITQVDVTLQPVFAGSDSDSNKDWSRWTPSGELRLSITNPEIFPELINGRTFFVDFSPAEE
jgi:hypothetical protein